MSVLNAHHRCYRSIRNRNHHSVQRKTRRSTRRTGLNPTRNLIRHLHPCVVSRDRPEAERKVDHPHPSSSHLTRTSCALAAFFVFYCVPVWQRWRVWVLPSCEVNRQSWTSSLSKILDNLHYRRRQSGIMRHYTEATGRPRFEVECGTFALYSQHLLSHGSRCGCIHRSQDIACLTFSFMKQQPVRADKV